MGNLTISGTLTAATTNTTGISTSTVVQTNSADTSGRVGQWFMLNSAFNQWEWGMAGTESGANSGSNLMLWRYNDAGNTIIEHH